MLSSAGESIVVYLTAVLTDLLHTQRDPLALCLLLQAYDKFEPPGPPCSWQLSRFNSYYSLWIPEQAREAWVSHNRNHSCSTSLPWAVAGLPCVARMPCGLQGALSYL